MPFDHYARNSSKRIAVFHSTTHSRNDMDMKFRNLNQGIAIFRKKHRYKISRNIDLCLWLSMLSWYTKQINSMIDGPFKLSSPFREHIFIIDVWRRLFQKREMTRHISPCKLFLDLHNSLFSARFEMVPGNTCVNFYSQGMHHNAIW